MEQNFHLRITNESTPGNGKTTRQIDVTTRRFDGTTRRFDGMTRRFDGTTRPNDWTDHFSSYELTKQRDKIITKLQNVKWPKTVMLRIKKTFKEINTVMIIMFSWRNLRNFSRNKTLVGLAFCK